jgi:hypothetical protein
VEQAQLSFTISILPKKKPSTISTIQNSKFHSLSVVGNITNMHQIAQKTTEPVPPNSNA